MLRLFSDNILLLLEPKPTETKGGIQLVHLEKKTRHSRPARVIATGPGYYKPTGAFVPMSDHVKPGDRVLVDELAGEQQDYRLDMYKPRLNKGTQFSEWANERGEYRIVRLDECDAVIGEEVAA